MLIESAVLALVVGEHPKRLTITELSWKLNAGAPRGYEDDSVERAARELVRAELLLCEGAFLAPNLAALPCTGAGQHSILQGERRQS